MMHISWKNFNRIDRYLDWSEVAKHPLFELILTVYPDKKRYSMEAVGIDVTAVTKNLNIPIEWPPTNHIYRFGLICFK